MNFGAYVPISVGIDLAGYSALMHSAKEFSKVVVPIDTLTNGV